MPDTFPGPEDRARMAARHGDLERICVSLDTLVRVDEQDVHVVADACYGLAQFLRARGTLGNDRLSAWLRSGESQPQPQPLTAAPAGPASAQPAVAAPPPAPPVVAQAAPGGPPCEEQLLQQQDPARRLALAKDGLAFLDKVNYYLTLAAARSPGNPAAVADAIGSIDCLPVPHAAIAAVDVVAGQTTWDQAYATFTELKVAGIIDGQDEAGILFALGDRPGTVRIVPGDERDGGADFDESVASPPPPPAAGAHVLPPEATPPPEGSAL